MFAVGLLAILGVAAALATSSPLGLVMTLVIAGVYVLGALEVKRFAQATQGLSQALQDMPPSLTRLEDWLQRVPPALQAAVRQRVTQERGQLPGLALTPYLIGLLVMLGMLGTFLGLVFTFKGTVFALEGSADLAAMRAALAEPIKGLGLAFGCSVAGVAGSALLGVMATLSRRDRAQAVRALDDAAATTLRPFSLAQQREATFLALQQQAQALPDMARQMQALPELALHLQALPQVAQQVQALMTQLAARGQQMDEQLLARQAQFHQEATAAYSGLAHSVQHSLSHSIDTAAKAAHQSLQATAQAATQTLQPMLQETLAQMASESQRLHERVYGAVQTQLEGLAQQFSHSTAQTSQALAQTLTQHQQGSAQTQQALESALARFAGSFEERAQALVAHLRSAASEAQAEQHSRLEALQQAWVSAQAQQERGSSSLLAGLETAQARWTAHFDECATALLTQLQTAGSQAHTEQAQAQSQQQQAWTDSLQAMTQALKVEWQQLSAHTLAQQQQASQAVAQTAQQLSAQAQAQSQQLLAQVTQLLQQSEGLVQARTASEAQWAQGQRQQMDELATLWRSELAALREQEDQRGQAAVQRLGTLQTELAGHVSTQLATLGAALEAPMTRLMHTASEAPKAAAEVIAQLRQEMSQLAERDNHTLQERHSLVAQISALLTCVQDTTAQQRDAIETLVGSASAVLQQTSQQFTQTLGAQAERSEALAAQVGASAAELAALGDAFHQGVMLFGSSNEQLMASLQRVESAIAQSMSRSDEQLAYYVAQAREVIDLSLSAQQSIVEDLRQLRPPRGTQAPLPLGVEG